MNFKSLSKEKKQTIGLVSLLTFGAIFAIYQFVLVPASKTFKEDKDELQKICGKLERAERSLDGEEKLRSDLTEVANELRKCDEDFIPPGENTLSWATEYVYRTGRSVGVEIETVGETRPPPTPWGDTKKAGRYFVPYAVRMVTSCEYSDFVRLIAAMEKSNPYICVSGIQIGGQRGKPRLQRITCTLEWPMWRGRKQGSEIIRFPSRKKTTAEGEAES